MYNYYINRNNVINLNDINKERGVSLRLKRFVVEKLYGIYDYDVSFHDDVTFLYGSNGCGKTTILNIITFIITGNIFRLLNYNFTSMALYYTKDNEEKIITLKTNDDNSINIEFMNNEYIFKAMDFNREIIDTSKLQNVSSIEESNYFNFYPWLHEIKRTFRFVFLPLSRNNNIMSDFFDEERYAIRNSLRSRKLSPLEHSLNFVKQMIRDHYIQTSSQINNINEEFRNKMFTTLFHFYQNNHVDFNVNIDFYSSKEKLTKTFNDFGIMTDEFKKDIDMFYKKFQSTLDDYESATKSKENISAISQKISILVSNYARIQQILELTQIADDMNIEKENALKDIRLFLSVINEFFNHGECKKEVIIDNQGRVYFTVNNCSEPIFVNKLSSGEQQLFIFFAYLIFKLNDNMQSIFIIDEPELSLHLSWQRKFVEAVLNTSSNIQLIFATHSPEIIGKYRDKRVKLIQKINGCNIKGGL